MNQHLYVMEAHATHKRNDVARSLARAELRRELRAGKGSTRPAAAAPVDRAAPAIDVGGFARGLRLLARGWSLAIRGRAVA